MLAMMFLAAITPDYRAAFILLSLPAWLRIVSLLKAKQHHYKTSYWLIGQQRAKNKLQGIALLMLHTLERSKEHLRYPQLRIAVRESKAAQNMWEIAIRNKGWKAVGPIFIGSADLSDLIAPGFRQQEGLDENVLKEQVPVIKTGILLPFMAATMLRSKISSFEATSGSVIAYFYIHGGSELTAASYMIDVDHPDGGLIASHPGSLLKRDSHRPPPKIRFEYISSSYIPVSAALTDGTPYSGTAGGSIEIADWHGTFVNGKPDGEFTLVLGDRMTSKVRFINGVKVE